MDEEDFGQLTNNGGDDELSLPKATVTKLVQEMMPSDVSFAKDSLNLLIECCVEFVHMVAAESNDICEKESKKTISPEHIITALTNLGFDEYLPEIEQVFIDHKEVSKIKEKKGSKFQESGLTVEELQQKQEELFELARQRMGQQHQ